MSYSISKAKQIIDNCLNNAIDNSVLKEMNNNKLYVITKNKNNEIETIDYNSYLVNIYLKDISFNIEESLRNEEKSKDNIYFYIPMGAVTKTPLFNDKGPKIPVRMKTEGFVLSSVKTKIKEYGINNALIEMYIVIDIEEKVILPITTNIIKITNEIPISYKIIKGVVPNYYGGEISKNSSIYSSLLNNS